MGQSELGILLKDFSLVLIMGDIIWVSVGRRLGHVSDVGLRSIKLRIVLRGLLRCKLQVRVLFSQLEVVSNHREVVGKLEVVMVWDEVVEHLAEVLVTVRQDSQQWSILFVVVRMVTLQML